MDYDRLGRRRRPEQDQGLRPIHPLLPSQWRSKAIRVAMSQRDWEHFDALREAGVENINDPSQIPSQARANGEVISRLMEMESVADQSPAPAPAPAPAPSPLNWMDWERQKTLRLLRAAV